MEPLMNQEKFDARLKEILLEEADQPRRWWYLSFAGEKSFLGGAIVNAHGFIGAVMEARNRNINPGGEVQGHWIPDDKLPLPRYRNRLLTLAELGEFWEMHKLSEFDDA